MLSISCECGCTVLKLLLSDVQNLEASVWAIKAKERAERQSEYELSYLLIVLKVHGHLLYFF